VINFFNCDYQINLIVANNAKHLQLTAVIYK